MNLYVRDPMHHGWKASSVQLLKMMGFADGRAPSLGASPMMVQDIMVWVVPLDFDRNYLYRHRKEHRLMAKCPKCGKVVSAGRLQQHSQIHRKCERCGSVKPEGQSCGCFDNGSQ
jgi:endogenous inhibitor of DNA gyrase (YacG/DUF329 family)